MVSELHLKRHSMPKTWAIKRKNIKFITKPNPGKFKLDYTIPIIILMREYLNLASTKKETKQILNDEEIFVNGKRVKDVKFPVGLFDILEIKKLGKKYLLLFNDVGKFYLKEVKDDLLYLKVKDKKILKDKKYQINFYNGFNILVSEKDFKSISKNDTIVLDISKKNKIVNVFKLEKGNFVYFYDGKFIGKIGKVEDIILFYGKSQDKIIVTIDGKKVSTIRDYAFVVGKNEKDFARLI